MENEEKPNLDEILRRMRDAASLFYHLAQGAGQHQFLEFTGFMNEYVKLCEKMHENGIDFVENAVLPMEDYNAKYIAEKLNCIFGPTFLINPEARTAFVEELFDGEYELVRR